MHEKMHFWLLGWVEGEERGNCVARKTANIQNKNRRKGRKEDTIRGHNKITYGIIPL